MNGEEKNKGRNKLTKFAEKSHEFDNLVIPITGKGKFYRPVVLCVANNNNNNIHDNVYSAVIMTTGHCESSLGSYDECRTAHKRLSTLRLNHLTWAASPPVGSYRLQSPSLFIIITQPES